MPFDIQIINPLTHAGWDDVVRSFPSGSFFHSAAWGEVLHRSYGYRPFYFAGSAGKEIVTVVPVMEVRSLLTGKRGVSLPFTDFCQPLEKGGVPWDRVFAEVVKRGKERGWSSLELRGSAEGLRSARPSAAFRGHGLKLGDDPERLLAGFHESTRRSIKRAIKSGVKVEISGSPESVKHFYRLHTLTRRRHGLPPQPYRFFEKLQEIVLSRAMGFVLLARFEDQPVAAAVFCHFGRGGIYKYGSSDLSFQHLRPNNLILWEAIKWFSQKGFATLSFGRTDWENEGLHRFKSGWGTTTTTVNYYRYDLRRGAFMEDQKRMRGWYKQIFRRLPQPVLNRVGALLYPHVG